MFLIRGGLYDHSVEKPQNRFHDGTIDQAATVLIREAGCPLHARELLVRMIESGMTFKGNHPEISVYVSLSRNSGFRMVSDGTFDLKYRPAA